MGETKDCYYSMLPSIFSSIHSLVHVKFISTCWKAVLYCTDKYSSETSKFLALMEFKLRGGFEEVKRACWEASMLWRQMKGSGLGLLVGVSGNRAVKTISWELISEWGEWTSKGLEVWGVAVCALAQSWSEEWKEGGRKGVRSKCHEVMALSTKTWLYSAYIEYWTMSVEWFPALKRDFRSYIANTDFKLQNRHTAFSSVYVFTSLFEEKNSG